MTATNHTEHYGLSQYAQDDYPTYTGDYNGDMSKIDAAIWAASQAGGADGLTAVAHDDTLTGGWDDGRCVVRRWFVQERNETAEARRLQIRPERL